VAEYPGGADGKGWRGCELEAGDAECGGEHMGDKAGELSVPADLAGRA